MSDASSCMLSEKADDTMHLIVHESVLEATATFLLGFFDDLRITNYAPGTHNALITSSPS